MAPNEKQIAGAYGDVFSEEPPLKSNLLLYNDYTVVTPHIAWATLDVRKRLYLVVIDNILAF